MRNKASVLRERDKFSVFLRNARMATGMSLRKFAAFVKLSPTYICRLERAEAPVSLKGQKQIVLAEALFGDDEDRKNKLYDMISACGLNPRIPIDVMNYLDCNNAAIARIRMEMKAKSDGKVHR